jgi:hypothetical protein
MSFSPFERSDYKLPPNETSKKDVENNPTIWIDLGSILTRNNYINVWNFNNSLVLVQIVEVEKRRAFDFYNLYKD